MGDADEVKGLLNTILNKVTDLDKKLSIVNIKIEEMGFDMIGLKDRLREEYATLSIKIDTVVNSGIIPINIARNTGKNIMSKVGLRGIIMSNRRKSPIITTFFKIFYKENNLVNDRECSAAISRHPSRLDYQVPFYSEISF